ncbi:hypothetical protein [Streptomyces sp. NBC_01565]|uniref:hypothetical protein n=1 Tax=unclassified Streptomyces TaxID=2593676 RepID=UPI00225367A5|nr:hypothetical protein [Streptomyces sp. NBC_01565]MCX4539481.1 hypothetical protein [Streptomyces sp. NBC_01565]
MSSPRVPDSLKSLLGLIAFVLIVGGASGLLHEWFGFIRFMGFVRYLVPEGYEVLGYVVMIAIGCAAGAGADAVKRRNAG